MRDYRWAVLLVCLVLVAALVGCGGAQPVRQARSSSMTGDMGGGGLGSPAAGGGSARTGAGASAVAVDESDYNGHKSFTLKNGLVTVVVVPELGGRVMEYKLGAQPLLWANAEELNRPAGTASASGRDWRNWGGYKVWPAPQDKWGGPPDPEGSRLDSGVYTGSTQLAEAGAQAVTVESPPDPQVTGLQLKRICKAYPGTTRLTVEQTMTNVSEKPVTWSVWDVTQVPGSLEGGGKASREARVYFPLANNSRFDNGFKSLRNSGGSQWKPDIAPGIMGVEYQGAEGKIGADSTAGWVAYADEKHQYVYVKRFKLDLAAQYPDGGCSVEVYTSAGLPYLEVEVLSPLTTLQPGESYTFTEDWFAARCPGPVVDCTNVGAISIPLEARASDKDLRVTGKLGVFAPGQLQIVLAGKDGQALQTVEGPKVSPSEVVTLDQKVPMTEGCEQVQLALMGADKTPIGQVATAAVQVSRSKAAEGAKPAPKPAEG